MGKYADATPARKAALHKMRKAYRARKRARIAAAPNTDSPSEISPSRYQSNPSIGDAKATQTLDANSPMGQK